MNQFSPKTAPRSPQHRAQRMPSPYGPCDPFCDPERRHQMIAQAAYFRARRRGFKPGHEIDDWLAAEAEVDTELTVGPRIA